MKYIFRKELLYKQVKKLGLREPCGWEIDIDGMEAKETDVPGNLYILFVRGGVPFTYLIDPFWCEEVDE